MDAFKIVLNVFFLSSIFATFIAASPLKRYDQRQDGDLNIQAHLDKIVLLVIPNKNINILDIKGQGSFDNYEDILPLLGKESAAVNEVKFKLATDDSKIKSIIVPEVATDAERKEVAQLKIESKTEPKEFKKTVAGVDARENAPKKTEAEAKTAPETQKKLAAKSTDGRTYQTLHLTNNRERVVAVSQEVETKKADNSITKVEKL